MSSSRRLPLTGMQPSRCSALALLTLHSFLHSGGGGEAGSEERSSRRLPLCAECEEAAKRLQTGALCQSARRPPTDNRHVLNIEGRRREKGGVSSNPHHSIHKTVSQAGGHDIGHCCHGNKGNLSFIHLVFHLSAEGAAGCKVLQY